MKNSLETRLGIFFALAILAAVLIVELVGGTEFLKRGNRVHALFNNVQDLKEGDPVKMAGYNIGRVESIRLADSKVKVTLRINRGETIRTDSKATIKFTGLLGQNFVAVTFGSPNAPILTGSDQTIESFEQPDLSSLMTKLESVAGGIENVTKTFSGEGFQNLLGPLADFVKENSPRLTVTFSNLQAVSTKIASGEGTIGKLIYDEGLYANAMTTVSNMNRELTATTTDLRDLLADAKGVVGQIKSGQGTLGKLLNDDKLYTETTALMSNAREITGKINQGQGSMGKLINDESLYKNVKMTLQKVEKATEGLEDQGALSVLGIVVGHLF